MQRHVILFASTLACGATPALAHVAPVSAGMHFVEHLILFTIIGLPASYAALRLLSFVRRARGQR